MIYEKRNNEIPFSDKVESFIDLASKSLTPDLLVWLKKQCEDQIVNWFGDKTQEIQVSLVIDSNIVIKSLIYYSNGHESILFKLTKNPVISLHAPSKLEEEVIDYIENKKKKKIDKKKLEEGWLILRNNIKIIDIQNRTYKELADSIIGTKDVDDVPFVGVYLEMGAAGILTDDKHFLHPIIKRFSIPELGNVVGTYHRGMFSFFVLYDVVPSLLGFIKDIITALTAEMLNFIKIIFSALGAILSGSIEKLAGIISRMPSWLGGVLLGAGLITALFILFDEKARTKVSQKLNNIWNKIKPILTEIFEFLKNLINNLLTKIGKLSPYISMSSIALQKLLEDIEDFKKEIRTLKLEDSATFS